MLFKIGDLVRWRPVALSDSFGIVVEVTNLSIFVAWVDSNSRSAFRHYDVYEALEIVNGQM
jgi:hypothetical protein